MTSHNERLAVGPVRLSYEKPGTIETIIVVNRLFYRDCIANLKSFRRFLDSSHNATLAELDEIEANISTAKSWFRSGM